MSPVLHFDIIALIIDKVGENNDTNLLKELDLVSHSFHQICIKHLFANIELHDANWKVASSKKGFIKLLKGRPHVVKYIRKITYEASYKSGSVDHLLSSPILSNFLPTISRLSCLAINASNFHWSALDSSLTSAFLHLMSLPTINHIDLSFIQNFPLSSLTSSVNLFRLDILCLTLLEYYDGGDDFFKTVQSEMMPKIREFNTSGSHLLTMKLLEVKGQDGRPAFNLMDLRQLSVAFNLNAVLFEEKQTIQCLLEKAKLLERLRLSVDIGMSLVGVLSTSARTLKVLDLTVPIYQYRLPPLSGLCGELEAMAGHNALEALFFEVLVDSHHTFDSVGYTIQQVENVLVKPGWSALRQVSFKLPVKHPRSHRGESSELTEALQSLPDIYLSHLSKLESVAFNYSAYAV